jgi:putative DNA primase/helicase
MPALLESAMCDSDPDCDLEMLCAADYPAKKVQWLWPNRIPIGKVTLLVGDPGNGKSLVALDIAARVSRGAPWPDEPQAQGLHSLGPSPGSVLILSAEDDIRDTIRPRLDAAGADPQRVFVLPTIADLRHDLDKLRRALDRLPDCRLIVIDPVNSYVGPGDSHFHTIVRRVFEPLAKLAAERGIALLAVSHLRKHDGAAIQRAAGSMGFVASARAVWTVCRDPVQSDRYLMLQVKNNFVGETTGLAYAIASATPSAGAHLAPAIAWQTERVATSAVDALRPNKNSRGPEPSELTLAMDYVQRELITGPKSAEWMYAGAMGGGFNDRTVRRALVAIGGKTRKTRPFGFDSWVWYHPDHDLQDSQGDATESEGTKPIGEASKPAAPKISRSGSVAADPSENLSTSRKLDEFAKKTSPLRAGPDPPASEPRLPLPIPHDALFRIYPDNPSRATRKLWPERTWALLTQKSDPDRIRRYESHLMQSKMMRILKSRCRLGGRRPLLRRVEIDFIKPHTFKHPARCRAP